MKTFLCLFAAASLLAPLTFAQSASPSAGGSTKATVRDVSPEEADQLLKKNKDIVVLDVRTPEEFKAGHIPGAKNIDFNSDDFSKKLGELDKGKSYLVHCAAGGRSSRALKVLEEQKLGPVYHLNNGFKAWQSAGKPVEK